LLGNPQQRQAGIAALPDSIADLRRELAHAYRIVANEGILDAFGHISVRHPTNPQRYFLSRSRAPGLVEPADIMEYDLDSNPIVPPTMRPYSERVIHGEIFKARPDVNGVCHHHAPSIMPFAISGVPLQPVFHLGAAMGPYAPFWDSRDEFGDTNLLVVKPEEGASLARALGKHAVVVMRRHGATIVGGELRELVFRTIYSAKNAEHQLAAHMLGNVSPLTEGEAVMAGGLNLAPGPVSRAYEYWVRRLAEREGRGKSDSAVRAAEAAARRPNPGAAPAAKTSETKTSGTKTSGAKTSGAKTSGAANKAKKSRGKKR
jgi:ribulose-5-phosphate 4-epimerase/fuculose-1-phosphate aldolase